jgi:sodium-dependent dicarboxylate transporter 2/3/5
MKRVGLLSGPLAAVVIHWLLPDALPPAGRVTAGCAIWMAVWWLTEALPLPATALLPLAVFPLAGVASMKDAAAPYAHKLIFLFMGGFMIARAMESWNLHRRIALWAVKRAGDSPGRIVGAFMAVTAFLSMWVSNTATALMMVSIAASVVPLGGRNKNFATCLMLAIAYGASIGGVATLIGTPPNALLAAFVEQQYGLQISFARWMAFGVPFAALLLPATWWLLTHRLYPLESSVAGARPGRIKQSLAELGRMSVPEFRVAIVFFLTAAAWVFRPLLTRWFSGLDDAGIAMLGALALFAMPAGEKDKRLLDWSAAVKLPWGVLLIFGGGLSLAAAITQNGVADYLGGLFSGLQGSGVPLLVFGTATLIVFLTEMTSNTATTAAFLPIFAAVAVGAGVDPLVLLVPVAIGASCAFMMPVATPPNAIVFASGHVTIRQMARAGLWLNWLAIALVTVASLWWPFAALATRS